jgi:hypothetical protein
MVLEAAAALAANWAGLRTVGFKRWITAIERLTSGNTQGAKAVHASSVNDSGAVMASGIAMNLERAARHLFFRTNCLERSLALSWLLCRRGIAADLRIGARKESDVFEAHAWIELDGEVLNDPDESHLHFAPFKGEITLLETQTR